MGIAITKVNRCSAEGSRLPQRPLIFARGTHDPIPNLRVRRRPPSAAARGRYARPDLLRRRPEPRQFRYWPGYRGSSVPHDHGGSLRPVRRGCDDPRQSGNVWREYRRAQVRRLRRSLRSPGRGGGDRQQRHRLRPPVGCDRRLHHSRRHSHWWRPLRDHRRQPCHEQAQLVVPKRHLRDPERGPAHRGEHGRRLPLRCHRVSRRIQFSSRGQHNLP